MSHGKEGEAKDNLRVRASRMQSHLTTDGGHFHPEHLLRGASVIAYLLLPIAYFLSSRIFIAKISECGFKSESVHDVLTNLYNVM